VLVVECFIDDSNSDWDEMESHVVLIYISLVAKDIEYLLMYLLATYNSSFENCVQFIRQLVNWIVLLVHSFCSSLFMLDINPLRDEYVASIFSHSVDCLLILVIVSFSVNKFINLI
jgi:hypothetical protein